MNLNRRTSSRVLLILILVVVAIGLGFLGDHLITLIEKQIYPRDYSTYVESASEAYSVPKPIIYALIKCESDFDPSAVSSAGVVVSVGSTVGSVSSALSSEVSVSGAATRISGVGSPSPSV